MSHPSSPPSDLGAVPTTDLHDTGGIGGQPRNRDSSTRSSRDMSMWPRVRLIVADPTKVNWQRTGDRSDGFALIATFGGSCISRRYGRR